MRFSLIIPVATILVIAMATTASSQSFLERMRDRVQTAKEVKDAVKKKFIVMSQEQLPFSAGKLSWPEIMEMEDGFGQDGHHANISQPFFNFGGPNYDGNDPTVTTKRVNNT